MARLQGDPGKSIAGWRQAVSVKQMGEVIGNSIPQCLIERVLHRMLTSLGYKLGKDRWENAEAIDLA